MTEVVPLYARHARRFDRARSRSLMERPYLERARALAPPPGRVLDLGCGAGEPLARYFAQQGHHVTGVDAASEMLELCRARLPEMTWLQADMRRLALADPFEIVIAWDSFFHLPPGDQRAMFSTFRSHTSPGGVLVFTSGPAEGDAVYGDLFGDALYHASLGPDEYGVLLDRAGFDVVLHRVEDPDCGGRTVWVAQQRPGERGASAAAGE